MTLEAEGVARLMKASFSIRRLVPLQRIKSSIENPRYLLKWFLMSALIGSVAGVGAIAFYAAIHLANHWFLNGLVGYVPPDPAGEGTAGVMPFWNSVRPWLLPIVTAAGGLVAGIIVFRLAPEAEGHGTDAAIGAFHEGKSIRARIPLIKLVASAITIGTGGSAGREGPAAQISAGFGSILANVLHLDASDRRIAIATGMGAGIGAIFRAPLGGAILAAEILYKDDLEVEALIPALIASIVGYSIFGAWSGWDPIFATPAKLAFTSPVQLLYYVVLGVLCGGIGLLYANGFLRNYRYFSSYSSTKLVETWHWRLTGGPDRSGDSAGTGHGVWLGAGQYGTRAACAATVGDSAAALCQDCDHRTLHRFWWFGWHLWAGHGHRRDGGGSRLAALLSCLAWRPRHTCPICDCGDDGPLRGDCTCTTGGDADGCGDDWQSLVACSSHDSGEYLLCTGGPDEHLS